MSISVGGINIIDSILNLEFQLQRTQLILDWMLSNNPNLHGPNAEAIKLIDDKALQTVQAKYPQAGITKK